MLCADILSHTVKLFSKRVDGEPISAADAAKQGVGGAFP